MDHDRLQTMRNAAMQVMAITADLQLNVVSDGVPAKLKAPMFRDIGNIYELAKKIADAPLGEEIVGGYKADMFEALDALFWLVSEWKARNDENNDKGLIELAFACEGVAGLIKQYLNVKGVAEVMTANRTAG